MKFIPENDKYANLYRTVLNLGENSAEVTFSFYLAKKKAYYEIDELSQEHIRRFFREAVIDAIKEVYPFSLRYVVYSDYNLDAIFATSDGSDNPSLKKEIAGMPDLIALNQEYHYETLLRDNFIEAFGVRFKGVNIPEETWIKCVKAYTSKNNLLRYPEGIEYFRYDLFLKFCLENRLADVAELFKAYCGLYPQKAEDYAYVANFEARTYEEKEVAGIYKQYLENLKSLEKTANF